MAPTDTPVKALKSENPTEPVSAIQPRTGDEADAESAEPERLCVQCERSGTLLERDPYVDGAFSCSLKDMDSWRSCHEIFRPHCPPWCVVQHPGMEADAIKHRMWFHRSEGLELVTHSSDGVSTPETVRVEVCVCEDIGVGLDAPDVFVNDIIMTPKQARHLASMLNATVLLASMSRPASDNK